MHRTLSAVTVPEVEAVRSVATAYLDESHRISAATSRVTHRPPRQDETVRVRRLRYRSLSTPTAGFVVFFDSAFSHLLCLSRDSSFARILSRKKGPLLAWTPTSTQYLGLELRLKPRRRPVYCLLSYSSSPSSACCSNTSDSFQADTSTRPVNSTKLTVTSCSTSAFPQPLLHQPKRSSCRSR